MDGDKLGVFDYVALAFLLIVPILCVLQVVVAVVRLFVPGEYVVPLD